MERAVERKELVGLRMMTGVVVVGIVVRMIRRKSLTRIKELKIFPFEV